jgi:hypothetical protein
MPSPIQRRANNAFSPSAKDERAKMASGGSRSPQEAEHEELRSKATQVASVGATKTGLADDDDVRERSHEAECVYSCNPLRNIEIRVYPGYIPGI